MRNRSVNHPSKKAKGASAPAAKASQYTVDQPTELMEFLILSMPNKGRNTIKGQLARGQISVNQKEITKYNHPLKQGDIVTVEWVKAKEEEKPIGLKIVFEDEDILVINKESGLLSIAGGEQKELTAHRQLMEYVRKSGPSNRVFIVHRLDRDTSGLMVFAKKEKAKLTLQNNWQEMVLERTYVALVEREVKKSEGKIVSWLTESKTLMMYSSPKPNGGQEAITHYKVVRATKAYSLLEIHLETGRKNQIRVHMQDIGHPVVGDKKYGSTTNPLGRMGLHAQVLVFIHPTTGQPMSFKTDVPGKFLGVFGKSD
ncbi:MAG: RluA family pseudouridine synthase [Paenibacillaceae bacterium]